MGKPSVCHTRDFTLYRYVFKRDIGWAHIVYIGIGYFALSHRVASSPIPPLLTASQHNFTLPCLSLPLRTQPSGNPAYPTQSWLAKRKLMVRWFGDGSDSKCQMCRRKTHSVENAENRFQPKLRAPVISSTINNSATKWSMKSVLNRVLQPRLWSLASLPPRNRPRYRTHSSALCLKKKKSEKWRERPKAAAYHIAKDMVPIATVEQAGFVQLLKTADPRYQLPSRKNFLPYWKMTFKDQTNLLFLFYICFAQKGTLFYSKSIFNVCW